MVFKTCCVYGCPNTGTEFGHLTYFQLPAEADRRKMWLKLISREGLVSKNWRCRTVCEVHFEKEAIRNSGKRKTLQKHVLPTLNLPEDNGYTRLMTRLRAESVATQTDFGLSWLPPRTRRPPPPTDPLSVPLIPKDCQDDAEDLHTFHKLCDKFLTKEMGDLVKLQAILKLQNKID